MFLVSDADLLWGCVEKHLRRQTIVEWSDLSALVTHHPIWERRPAEFKCCPRTCRPLDESLPFQSGPNKSVGSADHPKTHCLTHICLVERSGPMTKAFDCFSLLGKLPVTHSNWTSDGSGLAAVCSFRIWSGAVDVWPRQKRPVKSIRWTSEPRLSDFRTPLKNKRWILKLGRKPIFVHFVAHTKTANFDGHLEIGALRQTWGPKEL